VEHRIGVDHIHFSEEVPAKEAAVETPAALLGIVHAPKETIFAANFAM
jgi:hypothetical protein